MSEQLKLEDEAISITLRRAWDRALRLLAARVNKPTFEAHIRTIKPMDLAEEPGQEAGPYQITLGVPSPFTREWVEKRHASLIRSVLEEILDREVHLRFVLTPRETPKPAPTLFDDAESPRASASERTPAARAAAPSARSLDLFEERAATEPAPVEPPATLPTAPTRTAPRETTRRAPVAEAPTLNPRFTFDSFVVGRANRLAHGGALAVAQTPGAVYNPLFLYGPPGLGKTHLMHAIGHEIARERGGGRVAYISGETFTSQFVASLREQRTEEFRRRWRSVDVLLIDDIQFIAGREHTKEEFFHTFNALYQTGRQIVISSDRSPRELRMMDERLRSRFECGLIADIAPPDLETRLAILQRKAEAERMRIPDDVLLYMAQLVQSNIRTLEGALVKIIAYASLENSPVTTQLAANILERYYIQAGIGRDGALESTPAAAGGVSGAGGGDLRRRGQINAEMIQRVVASRFGLSPESLTGKRRDKETAHARQIAMHLLRELTDTSLPGIGQLFGGRDHSTVAHACERIRSQIPFDDDLKRLLEDLSGQVRGQAAGD